MAISPELAVYSDENGFVQRFLIPLLRRLGFGIVVNHHGQSEAGMDLIVGEIDRFAHVRYHGIQAKFENSISKSASHGLVQDATEAFADAFTHPQTGAKHRISSFYAVTLGPYRTKRGRCSSLSCRPSTATTSDCSRGEISWHWIGRQLYELKTRAISYWRYCWRPVAPPLP
jgi:hypothetical protein